MNPAPPRGVPRLPALCPCRSVSILVFRAGGIQKRNGRQKAGAALPFQDSKKRKRAGFKYKRCLAMQNSLRNGEAQICMRLPQTRPCARNPAVLRNSIKRRGGVPRIYTNLRRPRNYFFLNQKITKK